MPAMRDPILTRAVAERVIFRRKKAVESPVADNLYKGHKVTRLTRVEAISTMNATISPTERRPEAIAAEKKIAEGYPNEIWIPTQTVSLETRPMQH